MHPLIRKLSRFTPLDERDTGRLAAALTEAAERRIESDQDVVRQGEEIDACHVLQEGFACRYKRLSQGRRQITAFLIPGDFCTLEALVSARMDHGVAALTPCMVAALPRGHLQALSQDSPRLTQALWCDTVLEGSIAREWVANVGGRAAYPRVAHLLCEVFTRLRQAGLAGRSGFDWPITQAEISEAMGLSTVHTNRVIVDLREAGLIRWTRTTVHIDDWRGLKQAGEFDEQYLKPKARHSS